MVESRLQFRKHRLGATLVELLVVFSLIALLIGIIVPSLSQSMRMAANTVCKHNLREVSHALTLYEMENDGWLPSVDRPELGVMGERDSEPWFAKLFPMYLSDPAILTCPEDPMGSRMSRIKGDVSKPETSAYASFGINGFVMTGAQGKLAELSRRPPSRPLDTILLADMGPDVVRSSLTVRTDGQSLRNSSLMTWDDGFDPFSRTPTSSWVTQRHGDGMNVITFAGGVREANTVGVASSRVRRYYDNCAAGDCTFCKDLRLFHYSFAKDRLFWWTGSAPTKN